jgi:hypothetical protein
VPRLASRADQDQEIRRHDPLLPLLERLANMRHAVIYLTRTQIAFVSLTPIIVLPQSNPTRLTIPAHSQPTDDSNSLVRQVRMMPERLSCVDVADVELDKRDGHPQESIADGY